MDHVFNHWINLIFMGILYIHHTRWFLTQFSLLATPVVNHRSSSLEVVSGGVPRCTLHKICFCVFSLLPSLIHNASRCIDKFCPKHEINTTLLVKDTNTTQLMIAKVLSISYYLIRSRFSIGVKFFMCDVWEILITPTNYKFCNLSF